MLFLIPILIIMENKELLAKKEFIEQLLVDYDLVETDKDCNYNISGALLDATLFNDKNEKI